MIPRNVVVMKEEKAAFTSVVAVADPRERPGGARPPLSHGLDDCPPPHPPYLKDWIRHCVVLLPL